MTDRIYAFHIMLNREYREDDAQPIIDAVMMIKGVKSITTQTVTPELWVAETRAKQDMLNKVIKTIEGD